MENKTIDKKASLKIVRYGAAILRHQSAKIAQITVDIKSLARQMEQLMHQSDGVGIAANQVAVEKQLAVVDVGDGPIYLVNPHIIQREGEAVAAEGCLSLPGLYGDVKRAARVVVAATNLAGKPFKIEAEGFLARALQHEIDHLNGRLFIDRVDESTLHWLVKPPKVEGVKLEPIEQPTTLQDALRVFLARGGG